MCTTFPDLCKRNKDNQSFLRKKIPNRHTLIDQQMKPFTGGASVDLFVPDGEQKFGAGAIISNFTKEQYQKT